MFERLFEELFEELFDELNQLEDRYAFEPAVIEALGVVKLWVIKEGMKYGV